MTAVANGSGFARSHTVVVNPCMFFLVPRPHCECGVKTESLLISSRRAVDNFLMSEISD